MFVDRKDGKIVIAFANPRFEGHEKLADDDPELVAFNERIKNPVPSEVPAGGFIVALKRLDWKTAVDAAVAKSDEESQILYARATHFKRYDPRVLAIAQAIGKTDAELDNLFRIADSVGVTT